MNVPKSQSEDTKKKIEKIKELLGRISLEDIDRDEDLMWFVADLWCLEKHLSTSLYMLNEKIKKEPESEYFKKLFQLIVNVLKKVREERTKHLERLYFIKEYGVWCSVKHLLGAMMQASEVAGKDIHIAIEKEKELEKLEKEGNKEEVEKLKKEIEEDWENVKKDLETSKFCHDLLILFKQFSQKFKKQ